MKSMQTLIRVKQREIDMIRREQATLEEKRDALHAEVHRLEDDLQREMEAVAAIPDMAQGFGKYSKHIQQQQENLTAEAMAFDTQIEQLGEIIRLAFSEMKKYELAYDNWKKAEAEKAAKRETQEMDEIAIMAHARLHAK